MRKVITFTAASLLVASAFGAGEVYRWRGADGTWHYSDQARPGAELVLTRPPPAAGQVPSQTPATTNAAAAPAATAPAAEQLPTENLPVSSEVAAEVRAAAAAAKGEQCKKAEEQYQKALGARRIFKTDAAGVRTFLSSAEMDAARLQARAIRDEACGPGA